MKNRQTTQLLHFILVLVLSCLPALAYEGGEKAAKKEEAIKAQFEYSFTDIAHQIVTVSCENSRGRSSGSGFIANVDGETYLFTNQHVILGADKISFKTTTGTSLRPRGVQLSTSRDIARLPLEEDDGLIISKNLAIDAPIAVFGNSEGGGVATELYGNITGVGSEVVEVSASFVSGNSGSPVLNLDREVIGIASYVSWDYNDEDGSETRRFCYRLTGSQWKPVNWKKYNGKYGKLHSKNQAMVQSISDIVDTWFSYPYSRMSAEGLPDSTLQKWARDHNRMIDRIARMAEQETATQRELDSVNMKIRNEMRDSADALSTVCRNRARQTRLLATHKELTGYLRDEFTNFAERLESFADSIKRYGYKLAAKDYFYFK